MARRPAPEGADRRQQILESALTVFAEQGFEGATTKEIARRADVTQGLIYFYFPSKEDLFFATIEHETEQAESALDLAREAASEDPPAVVLPRMFARVVEVLSSPRTANLMRIMRHAEALGGREWKCAAASRAPASALGQRIAAELRAYLDTQHGRGTLRPLDTTLTSQLITGALVTVLVRRGKGNESLEQRTPAQIVDAAVDTFLRGLLPPAPAVPAPAVPAPAVPAASVPALPILVAASGP